VVNNPLFGKLELRIVIPITNWQEEFAEYDWMVKIKPDYTNGLSFCSAADAFQIKNVSINRFEHKLGRLGARQLEDVLSAIVICIGYI
jgi:mRNA interferase MazF